MRSFPACPPACALRPVARRPVPCAPVCAAVAGISLAATGVESLPINQRVDDNLSVPGVAAALGILLFRVRGGWCGMGWKLPAACGGHAAALTLFGPPHRHTLAGLLRLRRGVLR